MLTDLEKGYLAGIIDGEGSLTVTWDHRRDKWYPRCDIVNTFEPVVMYIEHLYQRVGIRYSKHIKKSTHKPLHRIVVASEGSLELLLRLMMPHLIIKKHQAHALMNILSAVSLEQIRHQVDAIRVYNGRTGKKVPNKDKERTT